LAHSKEKIKKYRLFRHFKSDILIPGDKNTARGGAF